MNRVMEPRARLIGSHFLSRMRKIDAGNGRDLVGT